MKPISSLLVGLFVLLGASLGQAALLYYNSGNPGWLTANAWSATSGGPTYNVTWSDNNTAVFESASALSPVAIGGSVAVTGMTNTGALITFNLASGTADVITFDSGQIQGNFMFSSRATVTGNLIVASGTTTMGGANLAAYAGTATVSTGATLDITRQERLGTSSNFVVDGGTLQTALPASSRTIASITINSGIYQLGHSTESSTLTVNSFSGAGGQFVQRSNTTGDLNTFTIDQTENTEYAGTINGLGGTTPLLLTKSGSGQLILSGTISNMQRTTTVNGGRLMINSASATFGDNVGTTAILVADGGTLGGTGTISTLAGGRVVVENGGSLTAGLLGLAGKTTYALGSGASLDISSATGGTGWLKFELGGLSSPGTSYDQIIVSSGSLEIGSGQLNFADFEFTALTGFEVGTYVLFSNADLSGTLADSGLSGIVGGYDATLELFGDNIVLTVVPEPKVTFLLATFGIAIVLLRARRRRLR